MGEVYSATDTKLKRRVAIKVLPSSLSGDPDRLARFQREAEVLAALNHPHIAAIYGVEDTGGVKGLVMELVDGPTLADLIAASSIPIADALPIAKQIASALEAAHEQGIVHRDLKPANIKVKPDGTVKVLDFGLAKNVDARPSGSPDNSPTITTPAMTMMGVVLGTAAYMSPEQARGRPVDKRTDIWAFGVVLYEMLTRKRAFEGEDVSLTLAAVMKSDPDLKALPPDVPSSVRLCLERCLQKEPKKRLRDIGDVALLLDGAFDVPVALPSAAQQRRPLLRRALVPAAAAIVATLVTGGVTWNRRPQPDRSPTRFELPLPQYLGAALPAGAARSGGRPILSAARDGRRIVYRTATGLFVHEMEATEDRPLTNNTPNIMNPLMSPHGDFVAFFVDGQWKRIAFNGGGPSIIGAAAEPIGATWATDGYIYFGSGAGISRLAALGGVPELLIKATPGEQLTSPQLLPDGRTVMFTVYKADNAFISNTGNVARPSAVAVQKLTDSERKVIVERGANARYFSKGYLLYTVDNALFGQKFDLASLRGTGPGVSLVEEIRLGTSSVGVGLANYDLSDDGSLFYVRSGNATGAPLMWVDRRGKADVIDAIPPASFNSFHLSTDNRRLLTIAQNDLRIYELETGRETRLTTDGSVGAYASWDRDERSVVYSSTRAGEGGPMNLWMQRLDASAPARQVTHLKGLTHLDAWSPDGLSLIAHLHPSDSSSYSLFRLPVSGGRIGEPQPFTSPPGNQEAGVFSPDGRFVAYTDTVSAQAEVVIRPLLDAGPTVPVSVGGGREPFWASNGELFYRRGADDTMMVVKVGTAPSLHVGAPQELFGGVGTPAGSTRARYAVTSDGQRFIMRGTRVKGVTSDNRTSISVVLNWAEELKQRLPE